MELDDFKNKNLSGNYSETEKNSDHNPLNQVIEAVVNHIKTQRKKVLIWISFLVMLSVIYTAVSRTTNNLSNAGYLLCAAGFILGSIYLYFRYKPLPGPYYALPVLEFIYKAERKIKFMNIGDWIIVILLLLILAAGGGMIFITRLSLYISNIQLLFVIWSLFFILLSIFGFYASKKLWEKEHGSIFNDLQKLRKMFDENR
jgi:predicted Na+-dependent transporter